MRHRILIALAVFLLLAVPAQAQEDEPPSAGVILSPTAGEALQGRVPIIGSVRAEGLQFWELSFGYVGDETGTWFLLDKDEQPVTEGTLTEWDTTTITDGKYNLRLTIHLNDGTQDEIIVPELRVRNYTAIETSTPTLTPTVLISATPTPIPPTVTPIPTPTPLPPNPMEITPEEFRGSLLRGALTSAILLLTIGAYASLRKTMR